MASSLVKMGAADGEVDINAFAFDIEKVMDSLGSMEAQLDTSAVIDEDTGRVSYGTSVNVDQEVGWRSQARGVLCCVQSGHGNDKTASASVIQSWVKVVHFGSCVGPFFSTLSGSGTVPIRLSIFGESMRQLVKAEAFHVLA